MRRELQRESRVSDQIDWTETMPPFLMESGRNSLEHRQVNP